MARRNSALLAFVLVVPAMLAGGCASDYSESAAAEIREDPAPNMYTLYQRQTDSDNAVAVTTNTNLRMYNQDMGRLWLFDRPSIMTPEPMPH